MVEKKKKKKVSAEKKGGAAFKAETAENLANKRAGEAGTKTEQRARSKKEAGRIFKEEGKRQAEQKKIKRQQLEFTRDITRKEARKRNETVFGEEAPTEKQEIIPTINLEDPEFEEGVDDRSGSEKILDVLSAPLSQPGTLLTKGPGAGGEAVARSRKAIAAGEESGAQAIATIVGNTGLATGALLLGTAGAIALTGSLAGATGVGVAGLSTIYGVDKFLLSPGELGTWAAVDNVGSALSFQSKAVADGVVFQGANAAEADELFDEMQRTIGDMTQYVDGEVSRNPKLWASKKPLLKALQTSSEGIEIQRARLR